MFANRFTAVLDANVMARPLTRNLLLSLAEAGFYRPRWSEEIMGEVERAIVKIHGAAIAAKAEKAVADMRRAFPEAAVTDYSDLETAFEDAPDPKDRHVMAAALSRHAAIIVTDNLRDFPAKLLSPRGIEVKSADAFLADTIDLDGPKAIAAIKRMRARLKRPALTVEDLLSKMEQARLAETARLLRKAAQVI